MANKPMEEMQMLNDDTFNATEKFKISPAKLINLVKLSSSRDFCEDVDEIEKFYKQSDAFSPKFFQQIIGLSSTTNFPVEKDLINKLFMDGLGTSLSNGIDTSPSDIQKREKTYGHNRREQVIPATFWELLWDALQDTTLRILTVAAVISIAVDVGTAESNTKRSTAWIQGFAILVAVFVCSVVAAANDYKKEKQFIQLNDITSKALMVTVLRDGKEASIHRDEILTGDIIKIRGGMELPADGLCIYSVDIKCDESVMTGEPDPVHKQPVIKCIQRREEFFKTNGGQQQKSRHEIPTPIMMSGTNVLEGDGLMLAIVVGPHSTQGKIEEILKSQDEVKSPLQEKLETIAEDLGKLGLYFAFIVVLTLLIRFTVERIQEESFSGSNVVELINFFIVGVTVVVIAIPEGLPLSVTLSLAFSTMKMLKDKNLVRKMQACETMGGANNICSDKTGTLTQNVMYLTTLWNFGQLISLNTDENVQSNLSQYVPQHAQELFVQATAVNSTATTDPPSGDATEQALVKFLKKCGVNFMEERNRYQEVGYIPFSSQRKRMTKIINVGNECRMLIKGASEIITASCTQYLRWETNQIVNLDQNSHNDIQKAILSMAQKGLRTIGIAYKRVNPNDDFHTADNMNVRQIEKSNLILIGLLGIEDVLRPEVPFAVEQCKGAGITVRMVTGDNKITAKAIASKCGIIQENKGLDLVIEGKEFAQLTGGVVCAKCRTAVCPCPRDKRTAKELKKELRVDTVANQEQFRKLIPRLAVMARSAPEDKYTLVVGLMENDCIVAVTGDGSNDAPALKKADVGFAMGKAGTQVAKNAADILLTDDNFSSIVKAVMWGRNIFDCIRKFLQFQLTINVVVVLITLIGCAVVKQELLQPIQMMWVNLIQDTLASLALATEPPQMSLLNRAPQGRRDYIISRKMMKHVVMQSIYQIAIICALSFGGEFFIPEYSDDFDKSTDPVIQTFVQQYKYSDSSHTFVHSGRYRTYSGDADDYSQLNAEDKVTPSRHFTVVYNVFVFLQVFNFLNCRKLEDEINIFQHILSNPIFFVIQVIIIGIQVILIEVGFRAIIVYKYGLTWQQWLICIAFGISCNFFSIIIKCIPDRFFPQLGNKETAIDLQKKNSIVNIKRGNSFEVRVHNGLGAAGQTHFTAQDGYPVE